MTVADQANQQFKMGDGTSKYEIVYATFTLTEEDFSAVRYLWDTTKGFQRTAYRFQWKRTNYRNGG